MSNDNLTQDVIFEFIEQKIWQVMTTDFFLQKVKKLVDESVDLIINDVVKSQIQEKDEAQMTNLIWAQLRSYSGEKYLSKLAIDALRNNLIRDDEEDADEPF